VGNATLAQSVPVRETFESKADVGLLGLNDRQLPRRSTAGGAKREGSIYDRLCSGRYRAPWGAVDLLSKPFTTDELGRKLQEIPTSIGRGAPSWLASRSENCGGQSRAGCCVVIPTHECIESFYRCRSSPS
jgi:hypothetical protein